MVPVDFTVCETKNNSQQQWYKQKYRNCLYEKVERKVSVYFYLMGVEY